jgi:hypothetical protein
LSEIACLIAKLETLGVTLRLDGDRITVRCSRERKGEILPLIAELRASKQEVLASLRGRTCRYDWKPGQRGYALECVFTGHSHGASTTVFRFLALGHDVLQHLSEKRMLTGQAAVDAVAWSNERVVA